MALLDEKNDALVVSIVYDGPPFSGKTTTLRRLSEGLSRTLETPEEHDGRTLFFDWLDYTGGRFEGRPIRCQVVSVPGQRSLSERRRKLLKGADSVVFVADTGALGMDLSLKYARELSSVLAGVEGPRPAVVVQANKRDVEDALPIPRVLEQFRSIGLEAAIIETTAMSGAGVREAFLFGVRLALDRVRELVARGALKKGRPGVDSPQDLMRLLAEDPQPPALPERKTAPSTPVGTVREPSADPAPSSGLATDVVREALAAEQGTTPAERRSGTAGGLPDPSVPSGFIWPPIEGRVIVQQALAGTQPTVKTLSSGNYYLVSENGWCVHSRTHDVFDDPNTARTALIDWARLHVRNQPVITERRCIVLSPEGTRWRLWQIVGSARSLDDFLLQELKGSSARQGAEALLVAASKLAAAATTFERATVRLVVGPETVAADSAEPKYVGLMPPVDSELPAPPIAASPGDLVSDRLGRHVQQFVDRFGQGQLTAEFELIAKSAPDRRALAALVLSTVRGSKVA